MLTNYFKITFRNILRNKGYAAVNILGLAVGMASCVLILFYVLYDFSLMDVPYWSILKKIKALENA